MAEDHHFLASFIILLFYITGSRADNTVFVQTGASVQLDIQSHDLSKIDVLYWEKDGSKDIVTYKSIENIIDSSYRDRVDFNDKTFSLTLRNMQKTDSGTYRALSTSQNNTYGYIAEYRVSVIDAVEAPVLTVVSIWSSSDSCSVNFTCRGHDLTLSSTYNNGGCSPEEVTSPESYTLILICTEEFIICNHSNPVSWKTDRNDIKQLCDEYRIQDEFTPSFAIVPIIVMLVVAAGLTVFCVLLLHCFCRNKKGVQPGDKTDYDDVETLVQKQEMSEDTWTTVIYHTVGQHHKP